MLKKPERNLKTINIDIAEVDLTNYQKQGSPPQKSQSINQRNSFSSSFLHYALIWKTENKSEVQKIQNKKPYDKCFQQ